MKSWNGFEGAATPAKPNDTRPARPLSLKWRALSATFVTLIVLAALDSLFPHARRIPPSLLEKDTNPTQSDIPGYGFDWHKVRLDLLARALEALCIFSIDVVHDVMPTSVNA